jgi:hypothetical protein
VVHLIQITRGSRPVDGEATSADAHGANAGFDEEVIMASKRVLPEVEWVFVCSTVLGSVAPGARDRMFMGRVVPYDPEGSIGAGTRWCSGAWLEHHPTGRGNPARVQGMASHIGISRRGKTLRPYILLLPDDGLEHAAKALADATALGPNHPESLSEWTFAVVRLRGRTRVGVSLRGPDVERISRRLTTELGVDWRFWFATGGNEPDGPTPDTCTIATGKGHPLATWRDGLILMEEEPVPDEFLSLADRYGNGFAVARERGWKLTLPTTRNRDLEADELATPRNYLGPAHEAPPG